MKTRLVFGRIALARRRLRPLRTTVGMAFVVALLAAATAASQTPETPPPPAPPGESYAVGIGDLLRVSIWRNPELDVTVPVRPDGWVSLPLVGDVEVAGLSTEKIREALTLRYKEYINAPGLTVMITEINSRKIYILGEVAESGVYDILRPTSLMQALAMAGGFTEFAKKDEVVLLRSAPRTGRRVINIKRITAGLMPDVPLEPGDTIVVP